MEDDDESGRTLGEYLAGLRRRKFQIAIVCVLLAAVAVVVAIVLPPVYRSSATILVQEQEVPPDLVRSTITSFADERIQVISQQVMTRAVLLRLVDKYGLYSKVRQRLAPDEILDRMRKEIKLTTVNADISDRSSGRRVNATIAFTISYDSPQADSAQKVVNELTSLYLAENVKVRQQSVAETTAFLSQEADRLTIQIQEIEANLAQFKRRYAGRLPDSSTVNMQLADRTGSEIMATEREITTLQERKFALEAQVQAISPNQAPPPIVVGERVSTPKDRLRTLQAQYASASAVYGADHPDIRRMQREIAALSAESGSSSKDSDAAEKQKKLEADLAALRERYSEDHPDVQRVKRSIAALKASGTDASPASVTEKHGSPDVNPRPDNPAYLALTAQIESVKRELNQRTAVVGDLRAQQRTYDARLTQIPEIEREYRDLTRDYDNAQTRYREVKAKQMQAEVAQELEKDSKAERFSIGEPANLPDRPVSPNRPGIVLVGLVAALGSGIGLATMRDAFDPTVRGPLELARVATVPILVSIPYIETRWEQVGHRRRTWTAFALTLFIAVALLLAINFFKPIPEIISSVMRKITFW